jgi:hypothetical protein
MSAQSDENLLGIQRALKTLEAVNAHRAECCARQRLIRDAAKKLLDLAGQLEESVKEEENTDKAVEVSPVMKENQQSP